MSLNVKNLSKSFGEKTIFSNFSFDFEETGIYVITGASGIGKTTFLRMIAGLDNNYTGEIYNGGRKNVTFAFQEYRLFPTLTALENAVIPNGDIKNISLVQEAKEMLTLLGFSESDLMLYPRELSGGMKQRVSLVRAFLRKSPIVLLDEPTKELNLQIVQSLYTLIRNEAERRLVIIVSHHSEDVKNLNAKEIIL